MISWCCLNGQWSHPTPSAQHCLLTPAESPRQVHFMVLEFWPTPRTIWDLPVGTGSIIPEDPEKPRTTQCFCTPTLVFHDPNTKQIFSRMVLVLNLFILHTKDRLNTNSNGLFVKCMGYYTTHTYIYDMLPVCRCQLGKPLSVPGHSQHGSCGPCSQEKTN